MDLKLSFREKIFPGFTLFGIKLLSTQRADGASQTHFLSSGKSSSQFLLKLLDHGVNYFMGNLKQKTLVFQEKKQGGGQITSLNKQQLEMNDTNKQLEVEPVEDEA